MTEEGKIIQGFILGGILGGVIGLSLPYLYLFFRECINDYIRKVAKGEIE